MWHSCVSVPLDQHFDGRPQARELFDHFREAVESFGPVALVSSKTRIAFMTRVRFAGVYPRKASVRIGLWLRRPVESPRVAKLETYGRDSFGVFIDLKDPADVDDELRLLIREARAVGDQEPPRR